jgi:hypothetical protein
MALSGCAGIPLETNILNQNNQTWKLETANSHYKDGTLTVSGYMKASKRFGNRKGHIDIIAYSPDNQIIFEKSATLGKKSFRIGSDYFSLKYEIDLPLTARVTVEYHNQKEVHDSFSLKGLQTPYLRK